jgi:hypothetical protein
MLNTNNSIFFFPSIKCEKKQNKSMSEEKKNEKKSAPDESEGEIAASKKRKTEFDILAEADIERNKFVFERELQKLETEFGQSRYKRDFSVHLSINPSRMEKAAAKQLVTDHAATHLGSVVQQGAVWMAKFIERRPCVHCHGTSNC